MHPFKLSSIGSSLFASIIFGFFVISVVNAEEQTVSDPTPLDQLHSELRSHLVLAEEKSWDMVLSDIRLAQTEARAMRSLSHDKIRVTVNVSAGMAEEETIRGGSSNSPDSAFLLYRYDITAKKSLYQFGAISANKRENQLKVESAELARDLKFLTTYQKVVYSYLNQQVIVQQLKQKSLAHAVQKIQFDLHKDQAARGEYASSLLERDELLLKRTKLQVDGFRNALQRSKSSYLAMIGLESSANLQFGEGIPDVPSDLSSLDSKIQGFLANFENRSKKQHGKEMRLEMENDKFIRTSSLNKPKITGLVRMRRDTDDFSGTNDGNNEISEIFGGVEMTWNAWDGGNTKGFQLESMQAKRQLEIELKQIKRIVTEDLDYYMADLRIKQQECELLNTEINWRLHQISIKKKDVREGRAPEVDVKALQSQLENQRIALYKARSSFYKTLTNIYMTMEDSSIYAYLQ